jgi:ferredoxin-NADP reductase
MAARWADAVITAAKTETPSVRTLTLEVDGWSGHLAGQHVDLRLTAEDGYTTVRSYSIASAADSAALEVTVDRLDDGEVSPYLVDGAEVGDTIEVRGPAGLWFAWHGEETPVQLIGGGSGIVPLMSMIRTHTAMASAAPFRLLYSVRSPASAIYYDELMRTAQDNPHLEVSYAFTREAPAGWASAPARLDRQALAMSVFPPEVNATYYVCGSTPFVENVANWLLDAGHPMERIRTERYGGVAGA